MRPIKVTHLIPAVLIAVLSPAASVAQPPSLSGKVVEVSASGESPLAQARVELLIPGGNQVKHSTYTDAKGIYAFRGVAPGAYEVVVKSGKTTLVQVIKKSEGKQRRKIVVPQKPARLDLTVRTRS